MTAHYHWQTRIEFMHEMQHLQSRGGAGIRDDQCGSAIDTRSQQAFAPTSIAVRDIGTSQLRLADAVGIKIERMVIDIFFR